MIASTGNEKLHQLTRNRNYSLRIDLRDNAGNIRYAEYQRFSVDSELNRYRLMAARYKGDAGTYPKIFRNVHLRRQIFKALAFSLIILTQSLTLFIYCVDLTKQNRIPM